MLPLKYALALFPLFWTCACEKADLSPLGRRGELSRFLDAFDQTRTAQSAQTESGSCKKLCPGLRSCAETACNQSVDALSCEQLCDGAPDLTMPVCDAIRAAVEENVHICDVFLHEEAEDAGVAERDASAPADASQGEKQDLWDSYNCCQVMRCMQYGLSERDCELETCGECDCDFRIYPNPCADI